MTLNDSGARHSCQLALGSSVRIRGQAVDVGKIGRGVRINEVRNQEACPSIPRFWKGQDEDVVGKNLEFSAWIMKADNSSCATDQLLKHLSELKPRLRAGENGFRARSYGKCFPEKIIPCTRAFRPRQLPPVRLHFRSSASHSILRSICVPPIANHKTR